MTGEMMTGGMNTGLWQLQFTMDENPEVFVEMLMAALDSETASTHQDDLDQPWFVAVFTDQEPQQDQVDLAMREAQDICGITAPKVVIRPVENKDWLLENRKSFPPLDIASFWIYGDHITQTVPEGKIGLKINAGQAFGSGTHATTHGCITMLEAHCPHGGGSDANSLKIADIGCGSGILAMAAAKLHPTATIIAVDNDILAVNTTEENTQNNDVAAMITTGLSDGYQSALVQEHAPYDVILANILPTPLMAMANDAARALKKDGILILSGLMEQHQDDVIKSHEDEGLRLIDRLNVNGWMTLVMTKP